MTVSKSLSRPATASGVRYSQSRSQSRRSIRSPTRSVSRSVQIKPNNQPTGPRLLQTSVNPETIKDFEAALNSARSVHDAPLSAHQLSLTNQIKAIGGPGYGNQ